MGRSRLGWAAWSVAPWALAVGVLLSITAEAGQEPARYASAFDRASLLNSRPVRRAIALSRTSAVDVNGAAAAHAGPPGRGRSGRFRRPRTKSSRTRRSRPPAALARGRPRRQGRSLHRSSAGLRRKRHSGPAISRRSLAFRPGASRDEFDPHHSMSPMRPDDPAAAPDAPPPVFTDGATPAHSARIRTQFVEPDLERRHRRRRRSSTRTRRARRSRRNPSFQRASRTTRR